MLAITVVQRGMNPLRCLLSTNVYTEINLNCVILRYNDIIHLHDHVLENWEHPRGSFKGPQLERILEKGLTSFSCLVLYDVESTVEFYDAFYKALFLYLPPSGNAF
jgi:hypothetical protein